MLTRWEKIENNKVKLEIEVAASEVDNALEISYRKIVKKINLPGFRKGKVPRRILEHRFGPEVLHEEALEILVPTAYRQALEEADVEPIGQPDFKLVQIEETKPLILHATVEVTPPVELGQYKGIEAEQEEVEITTEQVEQTLQALREQHARLEPKERSIAAGDMVIIDYKGYIGNEPFDGGEAENYSLEIGSGRFIAGFEEQLIDAAAGDEREVKVTFPEDYHLKDVAGKEAIFKVVIKQVKEKKLPELDDNFAKEVSSLENLADFKAQIHERMEEEARDRARAKLETALINKVAEASEVVLPEILIEQQIDQMLDDMDQYLRYQGLTLEKFYELSGKTLADLRADKQEEAARRAKVKLVLDALIKKEGITAEESEVDGRIADLASRYSDQPERIRDIFEKQGRISNIRKEIQIQKAIDLLVKEAKIL